MTLFRAERDGAIVHLRAWPDPDGRRRAFARIAGHAIEHVERALPPSIARLRLEGPSVEDALARAFDRVTPIPALPPGVRPPLWPLRLRTGATGRPFPFDPELAAFTLGRRRLLKREAFDEAEARADRAWLEAHGLRVRVAGPPDRDGRRALLASDDEAILDEAAAREAELAAGRPDASSALGVLLGYPACCVRAFEAMAARDDATLFAIRLAGVERAPPEAIFVTQALALASHVPCRADCPETLALARALLDVLSREHPDFAASWRALAARVHGVDLEGRAWALRVEGDVVADATELVVPGRERGDPCVARPALEGAAVRAHDGALFVGARILPIYCDHRVEAPVSPRALAAGRPVIC